MTVDTESFSAIMGIIVKIALTAFMGVVSYAFQEIKVTAKETQAIVSQHNTQLAILENNYRLIDRKLDKIIERLEKAQ